MTIYATGARIPSVPYAGVRRFVLINMIVLPFIPFLLALIICNHSFSRSIENHTIASMKRIAADHRHLIESIRLERKNNMELIVNIDLPHSQLLS